MKSKKPTSSRARRQPLKTSRALPARHRAVVIDFVQSRIEAFNEEQGGGVGVRKDANGYTLYLEDSQERLAYLRPHGNGDRFEVLYWSPFHESWRQVGEFGGMILSLDDALEFIANDPMDCFWR